MDHVLQYGGLDVQILQIYSYYQASRVNPGERPPPRRGLLSILVWFFTVGWLLTLLLTVAGWLLLVSGKGSHLGMRLVGLIPMAGFRELPDQSFEASTIDVASALKAGGHEQVHPALRVAYTVLVGWWSSAVIMLLAWVLLVTILGISLTPHLYRVAPKLATLARFETKI